MKSALRPMLGHRYQDACNCDSRNILGTCTRRDAVSMYYRAASWLTFRRSGSAATQMSLQLL